MTAASLTLIAVYLAVLLVCVKPLGLYIANVMEGQPVAPLRIGARCEALIYRLCRIEPSAEMGWKEYSVALVVFNALGALAVYLLLPSSDSSPRTPAAGCWVRSASRASTCSS